MTLEVPVNSRDVFLQASLTRTTNNSIPREEKPSVINAYNQILADQIVYTAQANKYGIVTELGAYTISILNLTSYLNTLTIPVAWNDLSNTTLLSSRNVFDSKFTDVMERRVALQLVIDTFIGAEDQTPPPKPTGLVTTPSFASIILNWNPLADMSKISHAEIWRASTNNRAEAYLVGQAPGFVYVDNIGLTTSFFYWIRYVSTASVKGEFNADINLGTMGTTGQDSEYVMQLLLNKLGYDQFNVSEGVFPVRTETSLPILPNSKYPPNVLVTLTTDGKIYRNVNNIWKSDVQATDLTGQVTGSQIANSSLDITKFASGIEPVGLVASLPPVSGYSGPKVVMLTTDGKLYRYVGGGWTAATPAVDITGTITSTQIGSNSITTGKIAANAVTAAQIAANTITASQIATDTITAGQIAAGAITASEIAAGAVTTDKLVVVSKGMTLNTDPDFLDPTAWNQFSNVTMYNVIDGKSGNRIIRSSTTEFISTVRSKGFPIVAGKSYRISVFLRAVTSPNTAYVRLVRLNSLGTIVSFASGLENVAIPANVWTEFSSVIVAEANSVVGECELDLKWTSAPGYVEAQSFRCEEVIGSTLIQDGSITTSKIVAGSIDTNKLAANAVTAGKIAAGSIVAGDGVIANAAIGSAQIINVTADKIDSRGLTIKDAAGTVIFGSGTPLTSAYANIPIGGKNCIPNSGPLQGQTGQFSMLFVNPPAGYTYQFGPSFDTWRPTESGGVYVASGGTANSSHYAYISIVKPNTTTEMRFPVVVGKRYEASAYLSVHRCIGTIHLIFIDSGNNVIADIVSPDITFASSGPLSNWANTRAFAIGTAPANAVFAIVRVLLQGNGGSNPYVFASMWYYGEALPAQTTPAPWSDSGASFGGNISGQITPDLVSTYIANAAINLAQINTASIGQLSALTATIGLLRSRASGGRVEIENDQQRIYNDSNILKVKIGYLG